MPQLRSIQYLRALAALLVVFFHATPVRIGLVGEAGVDIFFVISGFVMWIATADRDVSPVAFFRQRIIRVVPLYWFFTLLLAGAAFLAPQAFPRLAMSGERVVLSLLFVPHRDAGTGLVTPLLVQGWTLNYEMFFYLLMAAALVLPRRWRLDALIATMAVLAATGALFGRETPAASVYLDSLLLEFAAGLALGALWTSGQVPERAAALRLVGLSLAVLIGSAFLGAPAEHLRLLAWGLPGAGLVFGLAALERHGALPRLPLLERIGDASYALYLSHTFVISVIGKLVERLLGDPALKTAAPIVLLTLLAATVVGLAVHRGIERPLLSALKGARRKALAPAAQGR